MHVFEKWLVLEVFIGQILKKA